MTSLAQLQTTFAHAIFTDDLDQAEILPHIMNGMGASSTERLAIYRNSILNSFSRVLSGTYPVIEKLLGDDFFAAMAKQYACITPSLQPDLGEFGRHFPQFIAEFEPLKELIYLSDVAQLEWLWEEVFYAADDPEANFSALVGLGDEAMQKLRFRLSNSARFIQSDYPILAIWQANQTCDNDAEIDLNSEGEHLLLLRQGDECRIDRLTQSDGVLLEAIQAGHNFQQLSDMSGGAEILNRLLPLYVQRGWITGLNLAHC